MSISWPNHKLQEVAEIRVSNVDKKIHSSETPVKLCNYMDVYSNEYVSGGIDFMEASATTAEIERFGLKAGDVIITKDSESPDDIGIPTVITEDIAGLVCGYHLALIRPDTEQLDSVYLAKQLSTTQVTRYFSLLASGSTRYALPIMAIESVKIPMPPKPEQSKIAEVLSTVDRAIEQTAGLIAKQQRIKTGLMQDLLTRGIDKHGNLRSEKTHKFKDSPLGRIPMEWEVKKLCDLANVERGKFTHRPRDDARFYGGRFPFIQTGDVNSCVGRTVNLYTQTLSDRGIKVSKEFPKGTIAITIAENIADTAILGRPMFFPDSIVGVVIDIPNSIRYVELAIRRWKPTLEHMAPQSAQRNINLEVLRPLLIATPSPNEQIHIAKFYESVESEQLKLEKCRKKLRALKTALMQDLLTGKVRVTPLLEKMEVSL